MKPVFIGYFPLIVKKDFPDLKPFGVEEICSATDCISDSPENWINQWKHNEMWVFDSIDKAWSVVPEEQKRDFEIFAYWVFPEIVEVKKPEVLEPKPFSIPPITPVPMDASFEKIGYDIVTRFAGNKFEHSPLSCNGLAKEIKVNRYCLIDGPDKAFDAAKQFEDKGAEPGPYYVVEVWRQKRGAI